jgi:octaprenyl-diphosphate synthase
MLQEVYNQLVLFIDDLNDEKSKELFNALPQGKMLRSKLILQIAPFVKEAIFLASIIEMIHAASLLHDDVIDEATTRRGVNSINAIYGNKNAIMFGDILYSKAFFELTKLPNPIPKIVSSAVTKLSLGELLDVELSFAFNPDIDRYLDMVYKKTASLIEASAQTAAILAKKDSEPYRIYGKKLGIAFQIVDDILDIVSDEKTLGKPALNDFKEGKTTLPYIFLYESLEKEEKEYLKSLHKKELNSKEREWLRDAFEKSGALKRSKEFARKIAYEGLEVLDSNDEKLKEILSSLIDRTY